MLNIFLTLTVGILTGFCIGYLFNISSFYNGSIRITDYGVDLDIVDSKRLEKQKYIILSVKNSSSQE